MRMLVTLSLLVIAVPGAAQDKQKPDPKVQLAQLQKDIAQTGDPQRQIQAAMGLADLGPLAEPALPALIAALRNRLADAQAQEELRLNAAIALGKIGKPAVAPLQKLLAGADKDTRFYAIWALGWVGPDAKEVAPALVKAMADKDENIRRKAAYALGRIAADPQETLKVLLAAFKDDNEDVRQAASEAVAKFGKDAVPGLKAALGDADRRVRMQAVHAVSEIGTDAKETAPLLRDLLLGKQEGDVMLVAQALAKLGATGVPALVEAFKDERPQVRQAGTQGLMQTGAAAVPALVDAMGDKHVEVRRLAVQVLAPLRVGDKMVVSALGYAIKNDADDQVRQQCVTALQYLGVQGKLAVPALHHALSDPNNQVRASAFYTLQNMGENPRAGLLKALGNKDDRIRINTAALMLQVNVEANQALPVLVDALKHDNDEMRIQAAHALAQARRETAKLLPLFSAGLKSKTPRARIQALQGYAMLGNQSDEVVRSVLGAMTDADAGVRQQAVSTLQSIPGNADTVVPALIKLFKEDKGNVRQGIVQAAWRYGPKGMPLLLAALKDGSPPVRQQATWAMMNIQGDLSAYVDDLSGLLKDGDLQVRYNLINLLGRAGEKGTIKLAGMLHDPDDNVRMNVAATLRNVGGHVQKVVPALIEAVHDKNANVRIHAAYALAQAGNSGVKALVKAFDDTKTGEARTQIMQALTYSPHRAEAAPLIKRAVKDPDRSVRVAAIQLLPNLGQTQEVADILAEALKSKDLDTRVAAVHGFQNYGPKGLPLLEKELPAAKESALRQALLQVMLNYNHRAKTMVSPLTDYLKDSQAQVRWQAAAVLGNIGADARDAVATLKTLLKDSDPNVRQHAQNAINRIEPPKQ